MSLKHLHQSFSQSQVELFTAGTVVYLFGLMHCTAFSSGDLKTPSPAFGFSISEERKLFSLSHIILFP